MQSFRHGLLTSCALLLAFGCSGRPGRIKPPNIDPEAAASEAISLYDTSGDDLLDPDELRACPGVLSKVRAYDQNQDGQVSRDELAARIAARCKHRVGLTTLQAHVLINGQPLNGAQITFEPEPYLGEEVKAAFGTTNKAGAAVMVIPAEQLPQAQRGLNALHVGTYKVRVTHPSIEIPPQYNSQTTLGHETETGQLAVHFNLKASQKGKKGT